MAFADLLIRTKRGEGALRKAASTGVRNLSLAGAGLAFDWIDSARGQHGLLYPREARSLARRARMFPDFLRHGFHVSWTSFDGLDAANMHAEGVRTLINIAHPVRNCTGYAMRDIHPRW